MTHVPEILLEHHLKTTKEPHLRQQALKREWPAFKEAA